MAVKGPLDAVSVWVDDRPQPRRDIVVIEMACSHLSQDQGVNWQAPAFRGRLPRDDKQ
jgi:hypothetical protein